LLPTEPTVAIGIVAYEAPELVTATVESVRASTPVAHELWLLGDGADSDTTRLLAGWAGAFRSCTTEARGLAACLNRLASATKCGTLVILEEGCIVTPGWLERLLAALQGDHVGVAGPSTNLCWNEQQVRVPPTGDCNARAALLAKQYGSSVRQLKPLYSLSDFCYAVRRDVIDAIGPADEGYGIGPCWEMDYNIRAERSGWHGVWVCGAYVERRALTRRRREAEAKLFAINKRHYQKKFCSRQQQDSDAQFRSHCRGDDCPNFASRSLVSIAKAESPKRDVRIEVGSARELVTCIMPTCNRRDWVPRSIECFLAQDYAERELLIVDDGERPVADVVPQDPRIQYRRLPGKSLIGTKRNLACSMARGSLIAHWDDDDWYPSWRLGRQVRSLTEGKADVCGSSELYYVDEAARKAFCYAYSGKRAWVAGNTLLYRRTFWQSHRFPEMQVGEDTRFVWMAGTERITDIKDAGMCIASLHAANTSKKVVGGCWWKPVALASVLSLMNEARTEGNAKVMVSCIMPTRDRWEFVKLSLESFASQDFTDRELIIVDDGRDRVADLAQGIPMARYVHLKRTTSIGEKRNLACSMARGQIIAHWDDDDWYAPTRLRAQAEPILRGAAEMTGLHNSHILCLPQGEFWEPSDKLHRTMFAGNVHGGTIMYWKRIWDRGVRYPHINLAEDAMLIRQSMGRGNRIQPVDNEGVFVYVRHGRNAWAFEPGRFIDPAGWMRAVAPSTFGFDLLERYRTAALASIHHPMVRAHRGDRALRSALP
jgi:glycosyltransferase involved in cell wall biosynthesis